MGLDQKIFAKINSLAGESDLADWMAIFGARYLIFALGMLAVMAAFDFTAKKLDLKKIFGPALAVILGLGVNWIISFFISRPRPFELGQGVNIYGGAMSMDSFPSEHTTAAFAIATAVFFVNKKMGTVFLVLAAIVGLSRIFVGIHYPLDIAAGALVGILSAYISVKFILKKL